MNITKKGVHRNVKNENRRKDEVMFSTKQ